MAQSQNPINSYYRPYLPSDSEDSDYTYTPPETPRPENAGSDISDDEAEKIRGPDFSALALGLKGPSVSAGPNFETIEQNDTYAINRVGNNSYGPYKTTTVASGEPIKSQGTDVPTVIILKSLDRDKKIFTQPTDCRLRLPRVYNNIKGFSIAQLNLTSAFFYFNITKSNVSLQIYENGRVIYNPTIPTPSLTPSQSANEINALKPINTIRDGSYDINSLMSELQLQLNRTPKFYDFVGGFADFANAFPISGDLSLNFNEPGDSYYDALSKKYILNPTREIICSYYFASRYILNTRFSLQQILVAYYYPVLKEFLLDAATTIDGSLATWNKITIDLSYGSRTDIYEYIIHYFTGIDDPIILDLVENTTIATALDTYRLYNTFRYSLVNKYSCTNNPANNRVTIQATGLNTSLSNFLVNKYNSILTQQISANALSLAEYNNLANTVIVNRAIFQQMYTYLQNAFATYFAVDYGTYSAEYYVNSNYSLILRPGINAADVSFTFNPKLIPRTEDVMNDYKTPSPLYWPYMSNMPGRQGPPYNMGSATEAFPNSSNYPYNISQSNLDLNRHFIDSNGYIYTDYRRNSGDILVNIEANKYTIFKFRSKYRQSLQVESLPRQTNFRYPVWNKDPANRVAYPLDTLFDVSYSYVGLGALAYSNLTRDISFNAVYGWSNDVIGAPSPNFGTNFQNSASYWGANTEKITIANSNGRVYKVRAPYVNNTMDGIHKYQLNISFYSSNTFPIDYYAFLYHDIAALAADMSPAGRLKESPYNFKQSTIIGANTMSNGFTINAYAGQTYYTLLRPSNTSPPATLYQVVPWMSNTNFSTLTTETLDPAIDPVKQLSNYYAAIQADPDFIRLPITSTLWASNTPANSFINFNLNNFVTPIGYDANGVSTDLTDYIPFAPYETISTIDPTAKYRVDPITNYVFQFNTPYNTATNTYFDPGTANALFTEFALSNYLPNTVENKQFKIAQYYNTTYIHDTGNPSYQQGSVNKIIPAYNEETTGGALGGYAYSSDTVHGKPLQLGQGVCGYAFLPSDGIWAVDRITYKTNFIADDPGNRNKKVHCLGLFYTSEIYTLPTSSCKLKNALGIFLRVSERTYTETTTNLGFDSGYGTYYTFSNYPSLVTRTGQVTGFTQTPGRLITDLSSYYSIIAFTLHDYNNWVYSSSPATVNAAKLSNAEVIAVQNIYGTPIPYPFACAVSTSSVFYDGTPSPTGADMVVASPPAPGNAYGPTVNYGNPVQSVSQYEQSIPFVNSHLHYKLPQNIIYNPTGFSAWENILMEQPDYIHASVYNDRSYSDANSSWINGYMLFQRESFAIATYKIYTSANNLTNADRSFKYVNQLALQQIFPDMEKTSLLAVSGNSSNYFFLGLREDMQLRFKTYDPITGVMSELPTNPVYAFKPNYRLQHFVVNGSNGWYYSARSDSNTVVLAGTPIYSSNTSDFYYASYNYTGSNTELQMPPDGQNLYFAAYNVGFAKLNVFPLDPSNPKSTASVNDGYTINLNTENVPSKPYYTQMLVTLNGGEEEVFLTNSNYNPNNYYKIRNYIIDSLYTSNTKIDASVQTLLYSSDTANTLIKPKRIMGGANGSKWLITDDYPYVMGNRNDAFDSSTALGLAWQIFFPTIKIEMRKLGNVSTYITDLTGLTYPEWPHTCMFAYSNYTSMVSDISNNWGLEKQFVSSDVKFSGYYFNSYVLNVPLQDTSDESITDSNAYTYLAIRGYLPTENFQCMLRFNLPNRYDFGFISVTDLITEIPLTQTMGEAFNPSYRNTLIQFNSNFMFSNINYGASATQGLPGVNLSSSNFKDFMEQYVATYSNYSTNSVKIQLIQSTLNTGINDYISTNLQYILPPAAINRVRFTDPILFQVLWQSYLSPGYSILDDNWGLGWNLGFAKINTGLSTYQTAQSFYKIQEDYIYLKLNHELNINGIDTGSKENYITSREPTGSTKQYYCKLLLTSFGGNATTFIHNPITFNPPLNRLTNIHFQWLDKNGLVINNNDCDWDMTLSLTERYEMAVLPTQLTFTPMKESDMTPAPFPSDSKDSKDSK